MSPKELAAHYEAKVFDTREAAEGAGFVLTETHTPRNIWNKASAAQAIMHKLLHLRQTGEAKEIGLVLENHSVTGCYKEQNPESRIQKSE
ncbi:MAG: hypothetical protein QOC96_1415 [Acidobacteriota bacterium]|jgi:hypothetical protein|nr:hypothetical protein [Acidobacteriota bacterium]